MDIMVILGWVIGTALILFGIVFNTKEMAFIFGNLLNFIDWAGVAITLGGTIAAMMISFPGVMFTKVFKHLKIVLFPPKYDPLSYIQQIVDFAKEARMKGLLALEDELNQTDDAFLRNSLLLVVDSVEPEKVKQILESELESLEERHFQDRAFYEKAASYAPGFGMIGTLIGLVNMLQDMEDPDKLGPAMSVALITTFYGTILANFVFLPIANKLKVRHDEEFLCKMIICEGVQAIQTGENPKFIGEKLSLLIPSSMRPSDASDPYGNNGENDNKKGKKKKDKKKKGKR